MAKLKKTLYSGLLGVVVFALLFAIPVTASADSSGKQTETVYGYTYTFYSTLNTTTYGTAFTFTQIIPSGYIGYQTRLYNTSGDLVASGDWRYTTTSSSQVLLHATTYSLSGYHYSKGQVEFYNGNGYTRFECYSTPYVLKGAALASIPTNESGEIYGSEQLLSKIGIEPDLIAAVGEDSVAGYVKAVDLDSPSLNTLEEAVAYTESLQAQESIPLYDIDGETVIGTFTIDN